MDESARPPPNMLFALRLWHEPLGEYSGEWRGEIKNLKTGEVRYFRTWSEIGEWTAHMVEGSIESPCSDSSDATHTVWR